MGLTTAALILAGGQSRRMGQDKALLALPRLPNGKHQTLLQHTCTVAQSCASQTYVLTPWPERYISLLPLSISLLKETTLGAGPLVALAQGLVMVRQDAQKHSNCTPDWLLVLACDMPNLNGSILQTWQRMLETAGGDEIAALPHHDNRWEPLCGFYHHRCLPSLQNAIQQNIRSFQKWLAVETVVPLPVSDSNILRNCNTPTQWQQFLDSTPLQ